MSPQALIDDCSAAGVSVHLVGETLKLRGSPDAVNAVAEVVRANKTALLAYLSEAPAIDLVTEFMTVDGMTREEAEAMATISIQPRTPAVWLSMIADLNALITDYCASAQVSDDAKERMRAASYSQSLASIPHAIDWFRTELRNFAS